MKAAADRDAAAAGRPPDVARQRAQVRARHGCENGIRRSKQELEESSSPERYGKPAKISSLTQSCGILSKDRGDDEGDCSADAGSDVRAPMPEEMDGSAAGNQAKEKRQQRPSLADTPDEAGPAAKARTNAAIRRSSRATWSERPEAGRPTMPKLLPATVDRMFSSHQPYQHLERREPRSRIRQRKAF